MDENQGECGRCSSDIEIPEISDDEEDFLRNTTDHLVWCQICGVDISYLSILRQTKHIEQCCKTQTLLDEEKVSAEQFEDKGIVIYCSACGICLKGKSTDSKIKHFKQCHKKNKTSLAELKKIRNSKEVPNARMISDCIEESNKSRKTPRTKKKPSSPIDLVSSGLPPAQSDFLNVLNKAHYRPQVKNVPVSC